MENLKELSINQLVTNYYPGREIYLSLDGVVNKYRIRSLYSMGSQRDLHVFGVDETFSFSNAQTAMDKNKIVSRTYKKALMYEVPKTEEVDNSFEVNQEPLSLAALKYDCREGDLFSLAYSYSYHVDKPVKKGNIYLGHMLMAKVISKEMIERYDVVINVELENREMIQITVKEGQASHVNTSYYLGKKEPADFYYFFK